MAATGPAPGHRRESGEPSQTRRAGPSPAAAQTLVLALLACGGPTGPVTVTIDRGDFTMRTTQSSQLTASVRDSRGRLLADRPVIWHVAEPGVLDVSATGLVTALTAGAAVIFATIPEARDSSTVTVIPKPAATGEWGGESRGVFFLFAFDEGPRGSLTGSGLMCSGAVIGVAVRGRIAYPNVLMTLENPGFEAADFGGRFETDDRIEGLLNGSGFENFDLAIERDQVAAAFDACGVSPVLRIARRDADAARVR